jgi:hypothetical protein
VYDPSAARAEEEARALGCAAVGGVVELVERDDVEALLLPGGPWFGLWPLEQARLNKPAFCAALPGPADVGEGLAGARVMVGVAPRLTLLLDRLGELVRDTLGGAGLVTAVVRTGGTPRPPTSGALLPLVLGCARLFGTEPVTVRRDSISNAPLVAATLEFGAGRVAQVAVWTGGGRPAAHLCAVAERGTAMAELSGRMAWEDDGGRHTLEPPGGPAEAVLLERFARAVRDGEPLRPGLEEVRRAMGWLG